jgi:sulfhydrogenase subunit beta (sulfur reductase)
MAQTCPGEYWLLPRSRLNTLVEALKRDAYQVIAPTVRDQAIVYDRIESERELPAGYTDEQDGGKYRLKQRGDALVFGFAVGPTSWKRFLHPPVFKLWSASRTEAGFEVQANNEPAPKYAFLGVRSCELHAIAVQDRVFMTAPFIDDVYRQRREQAFIVALNCSTAGGTCFCVSMKTGPKATFGYDLALTELLKDGEHNFLIHIGTEKGARIASELELDPAAEPHRAEAEAVVARTATQMGREMKSDDVKDLLARNLEHPRWDQVAARCESCTNCTMVCPTCFCTTVEDVTDLSGQHSERNRRWDSCYTSDFSYVHGGVVRQSTKSRYRQWLTHKLSTWHDQFGTSGCVGCGRCITWCPVGIDLTEEVRAIRHAPPGTVAGDSHADA